MKPGSICCYTDDCIVFIMTGCDGKDYPNCDIKKELKENANDMER